MQREKGHERGSKVACGESVVSTSSVTGEPVPFGECRGSCRRKNWIFSWERRLNHSHKPTIREEKDEGEHTTRAPVTSN